MNPQSPPARLNLPFVGVPATAIGETLCAAILDMTGTTNADPFTQQDGPTYPAGSLKCTGVCGVRDSVGTAWTIVVHAEYAGEGRRWPETPRFDWGQFTAAIGGGS